MAVRNYYTVLGVGQADSKEIIRKAYRKLAKQYHPDLNPGDEAAARKMQEIGEAWEVLGDEENRKKHDQELAGGPKKKPFTAGPTKTTPQSRPMTEADFYNMIHNFDSVLSPDAIKSSAEKKKDADANPMDTTAMFERFMGFQGPKKKK